MKSIFRTSRGAYFNKTVIQMLPGLDYATGKRSQSKARDAIMGFSHFQAMLDGNEQAVYREIKPSQIGECLTKYREAIRS